jgi:hypothetical protein
LQTRSDVPAPPRGLKTSGKRLWLSVVEDYELRQHEADLLEQACKTIDRIDELDRVIEKVGPGAGERVHPAVTEARMQGILFARLIASLRLPDELDMRPKRRSGSRGVYQIHRRERDRLIQEQRARLKLMPS